MNRILSILGSTVLNLLMLGCTPHIKSDIIQTADSLLWANPDSCIGYLITKENAIAARDKNRASVIYQHAHLKIMREIEDTAILKKLADEAILSCDYRVAGEANYILGAYHVPIGEPFEATLYLKQAERLLRHAKEVNPTLLGMVYFYLGGAAEQGRLFDIANEYFSEAIIFLKQSNNPLYISECYHHLAKSCGDNNKGLMFLDSALKYSQKVDDPFYSVEIETTRCQILETQNEEDANTLYHNIVLLCDSYQIHSYAAEITAYQLEHENYSSAEQYLETLALDTPYSVWSREKYYTLSAELLHHQKKSAEAYSLLKDLLDKQTEDIESSAYTSTYIIAQKYDVAKEQEMRLQEQVKKQRAYIWIVVVLLVCICIGGYTYYIYKNGKLKLQLSNEQKKRLEQELESNRAILRARISERLDIARELYAWNSRHDEALPDILGPLSPKQAASDQQNWRNFYTEFNLCYNNVLAKLKEKHPALTETDLQYIALTLLKYDITEISFLLGIEKQTVWNRRTTVKRHMDMPDEANLNEWIANDMVKEYEIVEPQRIPHPTRKRGKQR